LTRIYLVRHAEAEGNLYRRAHGQTDGSLTKNGLAQTERLGDWFQHRPVDAVYSSDLRRAVRTAEAVASVCQHTVRTEPSLREIHLGEWEDRPWGAIARDFPDYLRFFDGKSDFPVSGAEDHQQVRARMNGALSRIAQAHKGRDVAVVSHGCAIRFFMQAATGKDIPHVDNASVSCLEWDAGSVKVLNIGDNRHLGELSTFARQSWWRDDPGKALDAELWFSPARLPEDGGAVMDYAKQAWKTIYGTMDEFREDTSETSFSDSSETSPRYLQFVMERERRIGLLQMRDAGRLSAFDGHISLFFLDTEKRGLGLGAQLLGEAVSVARKGGKTGLSLRVYHKNAQALSFYRKMGFTVSSSEQGFFGTLIHMRMNV
jgi:probable phosphoglycerate mutase